MRLVRFNRSLVYSGVSYESGWGIAASQCQKPGNLCCEGPDFKSWHHHSLQNQISNFKGHNLFRISISDVHFEMHPHGKDQKKANLNFPKTIAQSGTWMFCLLCDLQQTLLEMKERQLKNFPLARVRGNKEDRNYMQMQHRHLDSITVT